MSPTTCESEIEKNIEYVSVKFLLKQVYAAHTRKIRDLESEVKELKEQLENSKRETLAAKSDCSRCKEMRTAYATCKDEYKNAVLEQTRKLEYLETKFASLENKSLRFEKQDTEESNRLKNDLECVASQPDSITNEEGEDCLVSDYDATIKKCKKSVSPCYFSNVESFDINSEIQQTSTVINDMPVSKVENIAMKQICHKGKSVSGQEIFSSDHSIDSQDEIILVPDTLECNIEVVNENINPSPRKLNKDLIKNDNVGLKAKTACGKENKPNANIIDVDISKKSTNGSLSKKRALSDSNDMQDSKKCSSAKSKDTNVVLNKTSEAEMLKITSNKQMPSVGFFKTKEKSMKGVVSSGWADNFKDFNCDIALKANSPSLLSTNKKLLCAFPKTEIVSDNDDFQVPIVNNDENGSWRTSLKKSVAKKPSVKCIKSTSRFKMTLDAPSLNFKKPNYKQTKLSKSIFKPNKEQKKTVYDQKNLICIDLKSDNENDIPIQNRSLKSDVGTDLKYVELSDNVTLEIQKIDGNSAKSTSSADPDATCVPEHYKNSEPSFTDDVEVEVPKSCDAETFCPISSITNNQSNSEDSDHESEDLMMNVCGIPNTEIISDQRAEEMQVDVENEAIFEEANCDSFDRVPMAEEPNFKYKEDTVRNRDKRKQLKGFECKECEKYYSDLGLSEEEKQKRMKQCSRHRAKYIPPATPEHFWELEFPDTEECKARGYLNETQKVKLQPRRRRPLN